MTPAFLVDLYSGEIVTGSLAHHSVCADLAAMKLPELHQVERLAPALSRLARLTAVEIERRADDRARRRIGRAMAAAVTMRPRVDSVEEL